MKKLSACIEILDSVSGRILWEETIKLKKISPTVLGADKPMEDVVLKDVGAIEIWAYVDFQEPIGLRRFMMLRHEGGPVVTISWPKNLVTVS